MGTCFSCNVLSLYTFAMWSAMTSLTLGADYTVNIANATNNVVSCSPTATNTDYCYIFCDAPESKQYKPGDMTFDCGNSVNCIFRCEQSACAKGSIIIATNVANSFTSLSFSSGCFTNTDIRLPDQGSAYFSMSADKSYTGTMIQAGTNTEAIYIDCTYGTSTEQCGKLTVNATTAQYLEIKAGAGSQFAGKDGRGGTLSLVYCPQNSAYNGPEIAPCIFDMSDGGLLHYTKIYTQYGIPTDVWIKIGSTQLSKVKIACSAYGLESENDNGEDIATEDCYITDAPTKYPTADPTTSPTTPAPTMPGTLTCDSRKNGTLTTSLLFTVRMPYRGQLTFTAITPVPLQTIQATYGGLPFAGSLVDNSALILDVNVVGDYKFIVDVAPDVTTDFFVSISCESDAPTSSPTDLPTPSPTAHPSRHPTTTRPTLRPSASPIVPTIAPRVSSTAEGFETTENAQSAEKDSQPDDIFKGGNVLLLWEAYMSYMIIGVAFFCFCFLGILIFRRQMAQKRKLIEQVRDLQGVDDDVDRKKSNVGLVDGEAPPQMKREQVNPGEEGTGKKTNTEFAVDTNTNLVETHQNQEKSLDSTSSSFSSRPTRKPDQDDEKFICIDPVEKDQGIQPVVGGNAIGAANMNMMQPQGNMMQPQGNMMDPMMMNMNLNMNMNMIANMMGQMMNNMQYPQYQQSPNSNSFPQGEASGGAMANPLPSSVVNREAQVDKMPLDDDEFTDSNEDANDDMYDNVDEKNPGVDATTVTTRGKSIASYNEKDNTAMGDAGVGICAQCQVQGQGKVDDKDGTFYCHKCWAEY